MRTLRDPLTKFLGAQILSQITRVRAARRGQLLTLFYNYYLTMKLKEVDMFLSQIMI